jgi:hypothetical protein
MIKLAAVALALLTITIDCGMPAPVVTPTSSSVLQASDLVHTRYFRLPREASNDQSFAFGGAIIALDATTQTLFALSHNGALAEVSIPTEDGAFATYVQGFVDPSDGTIAARFGDLAAPAGLLVLGPQLLVTASVYYDAMNTQRVSHFTRSRDLFDSSKTSELVSVWDADKTGFTAGYLAHIPVAWQARLHGTVLTGQCCIPIVSRTSWGPAAFAYTPGDATPATPLLYYTGEHPTLGRWDSSGPMYGGTTAMGGVVLIDNTALFFGRNGTGPFCYGNGTSDPANAGTTAPDGEGYCFDPSSSDKGQHASPYRYQVWAYALADFAAVAAGTKRPWELVPVVWELELPTPPDAAMTGLGSPAYNPATRELYLPQQRADQDGFAYRASIHVFHIKEPS